MFLFLLFVFILIRLLTKGNIGGYQAIRKVRIKVFLDSFGACPMVRLAAAWQRQSAMGWLALLAKCTNASCSALRSVRRGVACKTGGQDGFATFLSCRALSPLQHAGLSRRSPGDRLFVQSRQVRFLSAAALGYALPSGPKMERRWPSTSRKCATQSVGVTWCGSEVKETPLEVRSRWAALTVST